MKSKRGLLVALLLLLIFASSQLALGVASDACGGALPLDALEPEHSAFTSNGAMLPLTTLRNARGYALPLQLELPKAQSYLALIAMQPLACARPLYSQAHPFKKHFIIPHSIHAPPGLAL